MKGSLKPVYVLTLCFVFILVSGIPLMADTLIVEEWVARFNGIGNGLDDPRGMAVDGSGNVYVTGISMGIGSGYDYATVKYNNNGNLLWAAYYNSPGNGNDRPRDMAIDGSGNVYVTGDTPGNDGDYDYTTVKYDSNGNLLWVAQYNGTGNDDDLARAIAVDSAGNVYVTGKSPGNGGDNDYATIKYNNNGDQLWAKRYDGPGGYYDVPVAIAVDSEGNVYVTGTSHDDSTLDDYATVKYNSDGNQLWVKRYNGPGNNFDSANAITVDTFGNVYVTGGVGYDLLTEPDSDYATIKYDSAGNEVWVRLYNGTGDDYDEASSIVVDSLSNIYVTGVSCGEGTENDYGTVKYDPSGNELWVKRYDGPANSRDDARTLAVDEAGNVYVTGASVGSETGDDYATVKYDPNGNELWVKRYDGPANGNDRAYEIVVDESENVCVTGLSRGVGTGSDFATVKYVKKEEIEVTMELPARWNMISLPVMPDKASLNDLFPEAVVVYKYQKTMGYVRVKENENFEVGMGYWILLNTPKLYTIIGTAITEYTIPVKNGWHMIGGCTSSARKMVKNGNYVVIYGFAKDKGYVRIPDTEPLEPGKGYWILFSDTSVRAEFTAITLKSDY